MDAIADSCDQRYQEMCADSRGSDLMALASWPQAAGDSSQQSTLDSHSQTCLATLAKIPVLQLPTRQDHDQVLRSCAGQSSLMIILIFHDQIQLDATNAIRS
jgi:hypothetical protein